MDEEKIDVRVETNQDKEIAQVDKLADELAADDKNIEKPGVEKIQVKVASVESANSVAQVDKTVGAPSPATEPAQNAVEHTGTETQTLADIEAGNKPTEQNSNEEVALTDDSSLETPEDHTADEAPIIPVDTQDRTLGQKLSRPFVWWWKTVPVRYGTLAALFIMFTVGVLMPAPRYFILNTAGVRVESSLQILNKDGALPIENIPVVLQGQEGRTNKDGMVYFSDLKLGKSQLTVDKRGYSDIDQEIVLGWGSNPLGDKSLEITGTQYEITFVDWLSGKPIEDVKVTSGEDVAHSDDEGLALLVSAEAGSELVAEATSNDYRTEKIMLDDLIQEDNEVKLVLARKHTFVSNRDGQYDLYKVDLDSTNEEILLEATGKERELPFISPHKNGDVIAYISTRDGETNSGNFVLDGLFIIDVSSGEYERIARSEQMQIIGWDGDTLVYVAVIEGVSAGNPQRSKIMTYNIRTTDRGELASANYFNDVDLFEGRVFYSVARYAVPDSAAKLFSITIEGDDKQIVLDKQVWTVYRTDYDKLVYNATGSEWYEHTSGSDPVELDQPLHSSTSRIYSVSPDKSSAVWTTTRDGKGVIIKHNIESSVEQIIHTAPGVGSPAFWASNESLVFRISTDQETADYIMSLEGGAPQKIADVQENLSRYFY